MINGIMTFTRSSKEMTAKINNVIAPDGGAQVCAPRRIGSNKGVLFCVILPSEVRRAEVCISPLPQCVYRALAHARRHSQMRMRLRPSVWLSYRAVLSLILQASEGARYARTCTSMWRHRAKSECHRFLAYKKSSPIYFAMAYIRLGRRAASELARGHQS
jgi:hypothetical protein